TASPAVPAMASAPLAAHGAAFTLEHLAPSPTTAAVEEAEGETTGTEAPVPLLPEAEAGAVPPSGDEQSEPDRAEKTGAERADGITTASQAGPPEVRVALTASEPPMQTPPTANRS